MGVLRKLFIVGTAGVGRTVVNPNSKKHRSARANEKQLKIQRELLKEARKRR